MRETGWKPPGFEIVREIGRGGMGVVFEGLDLGLGRRVAIKTFHSRFGSDPEILRRFQREARAAAGITHPSVVMVHQIGEHDGVQYLVMEYVEGTTIAAEIDREGPFPFERAVRVIDQACGGLAAAHAEGLIHRDIKPHNLMLTKDDRVKITDFGLVAFAGVVSDLTASGALLGTPNYMAPELFEGERPIFPTDIYAIGVVLYEMLAGEQAIACSSLPDFMRTILNEPFPDIRKKRFDTPPWLVNVIAKATAKLADQRYQSCTELAAALRHGMEQSEPATVIATKVLDSLVPEMAEPEGLESDSGLHAGGTVVCYAEKDAPTAERIIQWMRDAGLDVSPMAMHGKELSDDQTRLLAQRERCLLLVSTVLQNSVTGKCLKTIQNNSTELIPVLIADVQLQSFFDDLESLELHALPQQKQQDTLIARLRGEPPAREDSPETLEVLDHPTDPLSEAAKTPPRLVDPVINAMERVSGAYLYDRRLADQLERALAEPGAIVHLSACDPGQLCAARKLVRDYIESQRYQYDVVWWIESGSAIRRTIDYAALAGPLHIEGDHAADVRASMEHVRRWSDVARYALLVFSGVPQSAHILPYISPNYRSRAIAISLDPAGLPEQPLIRVPRLNLREQDPDAIAPRERLCEVLAGSSLALHLAQAYAGVTGEPLETHLKSLSSRIASLREAEHSIEDLTAPVAAQVALSLAHLIDVAPEAVQLLKLFAMLDPADIPMYLLVRMAHSAHENLQACLDGDTRTANLERLAALGFLQPALNRIEIDSGLHELLWLWFAGDLELNEKGLLGRLRPKKSPLTVATEERESIAQWLVSFFNQRLTELTREKAGWAEISGYLPHAHAVLARAEHAKMDLEGIPNLWEALSRIYARFGLKEYLRGAARQALDRLEAAPEPDHARLTQLNLALARVYREEGDVPRLAYHLRAATVHWEKVAEIRNPADYISALIGLAEAALSLGNRPEADSAYLRAKDALLRMREIDRTRAAQLHEGLARITARISERGKSGQHLGQCLRILVETTPRDDRAIRRVLRMLTHTYTKLGDLNAAADYAAQSIEADIAAYGEHHERVIADRARRAAILWEAHDHERAIQEMKKVVSSARAVFGGDSREVALHEYNLGTYCQDVKRYDDAQRHYQTAATLFNRALGANHRYTVRAMESLRRIERRISREPQRHA